MRNCPLCSARRPRRRGRGRRSPTDRPTKPPAEKSRCAIHHTADFFLLLSPTPRPRKANALGEEGKGEKKASITSPLPSSSFPMARVQSGAAAAGQRWVPFLPCLLLSHNELLTDHQEGVPPRTAFLERTSFSFLSFAQLGCEVKRRRS